jgi:hypothetical protein
VEYGVGWSKDEHRGVIVDATVGDILEDHLLVAVSLALLTERIGASTMKDTRGSRAMFDDLYNDGARNLVSRRGYFSIQ